MIMTLLAVGTIHDVNLRPALADEVSAAGVIALPVSILFTHHLSLTTNRSCVGSSIR